MYLLLAPPNRSPKALKAFETAEQSRLHHTERALKQFCQYERELLETKLNLLNHFEVQCTCWTD